MVYIMELLITLSIIFTPAIFLLTPWAIKKFKKKWPSVRTLDDFKPFKRK